MSTTTINSGFIANGITLSDATLTNTSSGTIVGGSLTYAVLGTPGGADTVVNAGSIGATSYGVKLLAGYANRVVIDPGAVFSGTVSGGNTIGAAPYSTLELASGTSAGTLSGLGTHYIDFARLTIDASAIWALTGSNTLAAGTMVTNSGTLVVGSSLSNSGSITGGVTLATDASLTNAAGGVINNPSGLAVYSAGTSAGVSVINAGVLINSGTKRAGVGLHDGGYITNASGGTIASSGGSAVYIEGAAGTVINAGSIAATGTAGPSIEFRAGGFVSNAGTGTISDSVGIAVYVNGAAGTVINAGIMISPGTTHTVISMFDGGYVSNASTGTIANQGPSGSVYITGAKGTVVNAGHIENNGGNKSAVNLSDGGSITNQATGTITGGGVDHREIYLINVAGTVANFGLLAGGSGVYFGAGGTLINDGTIGGTVAGAGVYVTGAGGGVLVNAGLMGSVDFVSGGTVTNQATGTIAGVSYGVSISGGAGTVINAGTINGGTGDAVLLGGATANLVVIDPGAVSDGVVNGGGTLATLELASGTSSGALTGLDSRYIGFGQITVAALASWLLAGTNAVSSAQTLTNSGTLVVASALVNSGSIAGGVTLTSGASLTNISGGVIDNPSGAVVFSAATSPGVAVINAGALLNSGAAHSIIALLDGGYVSNASTGTIIDNAAHAPVYITGATGTVLNAGQIDSGGGKAAVDLFEGGSFTNQTGGTISGGGTGHSEVYVTGAAGTVTNFGLLTGGSGVHLQAGGTVINDGTIGGTIAGAGVYITGAGGGVVVNAGLMGSVDLTTGGAVTNQAGGTIAGPSIGVNIHGAAGTVINAGTINGGTGDAILFGGTYANLVVVDPGAVFDGKVNGGGTLATLELASGASVGTLTGLGSNYVGFGQITVAALASWMFDGTDTIASGQTLTNNGSITGGVTLAGGASLTNFAGGVIDNPAGRGVYSAATSAGVAVVNAGTLLNAGTDAAVGLYDGGYVKNTLPGTISSTANAGIYIKGAAGTVINAGGISSGGGNNHRAIELFAGGYVYNAASGIISAVSGAGAGIVMMGAIGTVVNLGRILGGGVHSGLALDLGGSVTNRSGGTISGGSNGIYITGGTGTLVNAGLVSGGTTITAVELFAGGGVTNQSGGTIIGGANGVYVKGGTATVINAGMILTSGGTHAAVALKLGGYISNAGTGTISGTGGIGIYVNGGTGTVINDGRIAGAGAGEGIDLVAGGYVSNAGTGTIIASDNTGVLGLGGTNTIINYGLIAAAGPGSGVDLHALGYISNAASGTISGGRAGVYVKYAAATVNNAGRITGASIGGGVDLIDGGGVTNAAGGVILSANETAVYIGNAGGTVFNAGSIGGGVDSSVVFKAGFNDRLIVAPGATFAGIADGGNTVGGAAISTLELASAATAGTLSDLGSQYVNFAQITVGPGASWTLTGASTIAAGETLTELGGARLTAAGTLVNDGTIIVDPSTLIAAGLTGTGSVTIDADSTVTVGGSVSAGETLVFAGTNAVLNLADPAGFAGTIQGQGPTDQVNTPRTLVWTAAQNTDFANAFNWDDLTTPANPASAPPGVLDTAEFLATGGTVTGTATVAILQFGSLGQWALGSGAALTAGIGITVGNGMLAVDGGASIASAGSVDVISGTGGLGASVAVSGVDAAWTSAGNLIVGDGGLGALAIEADGTVASNAGTIANQSGAGGSEVNVTGAGSDWQIAGTLVVGNAAQGGLDIAAGATVTAASLIAAAQSGGDGVITVAGTNSLLQLTGSVTLGAQGAGELAILAGATVSALDLTIGGSPALSSGNVDVEGAGSELSIATGGALNIGVASGGGGVLTIGSDAILNFAGIPTESGHASFNNYGTVDPDGFEYTTASNGNAGLNLYDLYIGNIGAVQVSSGTSTWFTPMVLTGTSVADATNNIGNGDVGEWQLSSDGTLVFNANTVDAGQAIVFEDATDTLVIGQQVDGGQPGTSGETPTVSPGAANLLAAGGFAAELWGYQAGDQILFDNLVVNSDSIVGGNTLELFGAGGTLLGELTFYNKAGTRPLGSSGMAAAAAQLECFAAGTRLLTARGEVAVEAIAVGERVCVLLGDAGDGRAGDGRMGDGLAGDGVGGDGLGGDGRAGDGVGGNGLAEVVWVGQREVDCARHPQPGKVWPVRVAAGAFGAGRPHSDLWLSPDHAVYVAEVLIPVKYLINGSTIVQVPVDSITYHHIELAQHDVLLAEGLPVESYLDIKDGRNYPDRAGAVRLYPDYTARMWEAFGCARLVVTGPELAAARALVAEVAGEQEAA